MIEYVNAEDSDRWIECLNKIGVFDFYHTNSYHKIAELNNEGLPVLFYYTNDKYKIAFPLLKREIEGTSYCDYTSVYGYPGPVSNFEIIPEYILYEFYAELNEKLSQENVISLFSRLNPLIQNNILDGLGAVENNCETVYVDLLKPLDEQKKSYRKSLKSELNQLRKRHLVNTYFTDSDRDISKFISLYYENMKRVNAKEYYYFSENYFKSFFNQNEFEVKLMIAEKENEIIAGAMFTFTNNIIQYHLAATKQEFMSIAPLKLILDEVRILGTENECSFLHLGGGLGTGIDPLFNFKAAFSKERLNFKIWKCIFDKNKYDNLVGDIKDVKENSFFPLYRFRK